MNLETLKKLVEKSFGIMCNANDFFEYATSDYVIIDPDDLEWVIPVCEKYPHSGLFACMSFIRKKMPLQYYRTEEFGLAYNEIVKLNPEVNSEY